MTGSDLAELMNDPAASRAHGDGDGDGLTTQLLRAEVDGERLTHAELASFFILLVAAGNETTRNTELGGQHLTAGEKVCQFYWSANRDEEVFADPYRFDIGRTPNEHLGFGGPGPHYCMGAHLARREITVMYRELFRRLPDIEAAAEPDPLRSSFIHEVKRLPARFTPTGRR